MKRFTLIELLVVIAIFGILTSMLLPSLKNAKRSSYSVVCMSNLRQLGTWSMIFADEHNGILPHSSSNDEAISSSANRYWDNSVYKESEKFTHFYTMWVDYDMPKEGLNCPQARIELQPRYSGEGNTWSDYGQNWYMGGYKREEWPRISRMSEKSFLYSDGYIWGLVNGQEYHIPSFIHIQTGGNGNLPWMTDNFSHPGLEGHTKNTANFLMGDIHVKRKTRSKLVLLSGAALDEFNAKN